MEKKGEKREIYIIMFSVFALLLLISIVSAGFSDWFKTITGKAQEQFQNMTIKVKGLNPAKIVYVSEGMVVTPVASSFKTVTFEVHMYDKDGINDLNHTSVSANFSLPGETTRVSNTCNRQFPNVESKTANYSCSIDMWYWDGAGTNWNINVRGTDLGNKTWVYNTSTTFQYNPLLSMEISPVELPWPEIIPESTNQTPAIPTIINNTGNFKGNITIFAINLLGEDNSSEAIYAENFTVSNMTTGFECDFAYSTKLVNGSNKQISQSYSNPGNLSAGSGQEKLYYCIPAVPLVSSQTYSTKIGGSWTILY